MMKALFTRLYSIAPLILCCATIGWGGNTIAGRLAVGEISPMMLIFLRWVTVALIMLLAQGREMRAAWPIIRPHLKWVLMMGSVGFCYFNAVFYIAAHFTTAINMGIIQSIMPAMILLGSFVLYGTTIGVIQGIGLVLTFFGVVIVVTQGAVGEVLGMQFNSGDILMLVCCVLYAIYAINLRNRPPVSMFVLMGYMALASLLMTIPLVIIEAVFFESVMPRGDGWLIVLFIALMPSLISQLLFMRGVDLIGPGAAGLYVNTVPIFGALLAIIILGEQFRLYHAIALAVVFSGIYLFEIRGRKG